MSRRLPPLVALRAFDAVARSGSLRLAGEDLSVHHTAVGRHLRNLEQWLGVQLTRPGPTGVVLTPEGQAYFERIQHAFTIVEAATDELRPWATRELRLWSAPGVAMVWLTPRLDQMKAALNGVDILVRSAEEFPDLQRREADAAIYYAVESVPGGVGEDLIQPRIMAVASPELLKKSPPLREPRDLLDAPLLHEDSRERWTRWFQENGVEVRKPLSGTRLWYAHVATEAAALGHGIALTNELLARQDLLSGRLIEVVPTNTFFGTYRFFAAKERWREAPIMRLRNWLRENLLAFLS
jgi:LysR family glycine cleavage system transcriptional activator